MFKTREQKALGMNRQFLVLTSLLLSSYAVSSLASGAEDYRAILPTSGLYQVDVSSKRTDFCRATIETHQRTDGKMVMFFPIKS